MTELVIQIDAELLDQLRQRAAQAGVSLDQYVTHGMRQLVRAPDPSFLALVEELLAEDAELLRRLA